MIDEIWSRLCGPLGGMLVAGTVTVVGGLRRRLWPAALLLGLVLLGAGTEVGCFDARPHVGEKFDATSLFWMRSLVLRALTGAAMLILAAPLGTAVGRLLGIARGARGGLAVLGPLGLGLLASSLVCLSAVLSQRVGETEVRLASLQRGVTASVWLLLASALVTGLVTAVLAPRILGLLDTRRA